MNNNKSNIGLIGLAVMGANLARNIASHDYSISVYNRTYQKTKDLLEDHAHPMLRGFEDLKSFVESLERPRKVIVLVQAGNPVQAVIDSLLPFLEPEDIIIDAGNSHFYSTIKRFHELKEKSIRYIGSGVSGGEEGALKGPSLMPGGDFSAWQEIQPIFEAIAAKDFDNQPCVTYVGADGAGHYVKMVHNGIEYGVMQLMAEVYELLKKSYKMSAEEIGDIFEKLNQGKLNSYLFEIAIPVLKKKDDLEDGFLIDKILDKAAQKGTGKWTALDALNRNCSLPTITEAVFARILSSHKTLRKELSVHNYKENLQTISIDKESIFPIIEDGLYTAMLSTYAQGYHLIQQAAIEQNWNIDLAEVSRIWEGGCIIRAKVLKQLHHAYQETKYKQSHLFAIPSIQKSLQKNFKHLQKLCEAATKQGIPTLALSSSLSYLIAMTQEQSSANFIQGLRDYFGAHTYERVDRPGNFHTNWLEEDN